MKITIKKLNISDNISNEVKSHKVFRDKKVTDENGKLLFHKDGIFSERIFGRRNRCSCGSQKIPGICPICECRVLENNKYPDYYIKFNIDIPLAGIKFENKLIDNLLNFRGFLYENKYVELDLLNTDISTYSDEDKILFGKDAVVSLNLLTEEEINQATTTKIFIPHPSYRPLIKTNDSYKLGRLNIALINVLKKKLLLSAYEEPSKENKIANLILCSELLSAINEVYEELFIILAKNRKSIISKEVRGQQITGCARGVIVNKFELDEDTILIGKYFIKTLYPILYKKYSKTKLVEAKDGRIIEVIDENTVDIKALNRELEDNKYLVTFNRPPSIGEKSTIAMRPVFNEKEEEKYVLGINPIIDNGLAADHDGDCLLVTAIYTEDANIELEQFLPSNNYIGGDNLEIRNSIPEDFLYTLKVKLEHED